MGHLLRPVLRGGAFGLYSRLPTAAVNSSSDRPFPFLMLRLIEGGGRPFWGWPTGGLCQTLAKPSSRLKPVQRLNIQLLKEGFARIPRGWGVAVWHSPFLAEA